MQRICLKKLLQIYFFIVIYSCKKGKPKFCYNCSYCTGVHTPWIFSLHQHPDIISTAAIARNPAHVLLYFNSRTTTDRASTFSPLRFYLLSSPHFPILRSNLYLLLSIYLFNWKSEPKRLQPTIRLFPSLNLQLSMTLSSLLLNQLFCKSHWHLSSWTQRKVDWADVLALSQKIFSAPKNSITIPEWDEKEWSLHQLCQTIISWLQNNEPIWNPFNKQLAFASYKLWDKRKNVSKFQKRFKQHSVFLFKHLSAEQA